MEEMMKQQRRTRQRLGGRGIVRKEGGHAWTGGTSLRATAQIAAGSCSPAEPDRL